MKKRLTTIFTIPFFIFSLNLNAAPKNYGTVKILEVTSIYDADTFRVNIKGWPPIIGERVPIRVNGIDAPEIRGKCEAEKNGKDS